MAQIAIENRTVTANKMIYRSRCKPKRTCTPQTTYGPIAVGIYRRYAYVPEHRPKPVNLLANMTSRLQIEDIAYRHVLWMRDWNVYQNYYHTTWGSWGFKEHIPNSAPYTGWEQRVRESISAESVNLGQSMFEYRQTCQMFSDTAKVVDDVFKAYIRARRYRRRFTVANVAQANLYASFGVVPTLSDLKDSMELLAARFNVAPMMVRRFSGQLAKKSSWTKNLATGVTAGNWHRSQRWQIYVGYSSDPRRFTVGNPAAIAWELTPWSWLVDGLVDIGGYLASLDALSGVQFVRGTLVTKDKITGRSTETGDPYAVCIQSGKYTRRRYSRSVISTVPLGRPKWVASSSYNKVINGISALVAQRASPQYVEVKGPLLLSPKKLFSFSSRS